MAKLEFNKEEMRLLLGMVDEQIFNIKEDMNADRIPEKEAYYNLASIIKIGLNSHKLKLIKP